MVLNGLCSSTPIHVQLFSWTIELNGSLGTAICCKLRKCLGTLVCGSRRLKTIANGGSSRDRLRQSCFRCHGNEIHGGRIPTFPGTLYRGSRIHDNDLMVPHELTGTWN
jgi:hypothetical protein